jgi:hypothetical protein
MNNKPRRRWYQFSLRTMFVLTIVVSIPLAWVGYSLNWIRQRREAIRCGYVIKSPWSRVLARNGSNMPDAPWALRIFGERGVTCVICIPEYREMAKRLFPEARIEGEYTEHIDTSLLPGP